jgi:tetratricopeptide (TPR) repeat protein
LFWRLRSEAETLRNQGRYDEAISKLAQAYKEASFGSYEQTIAMWETTKTYEAMGEYQLAINFCEGAAQTTQNENQAAAFRQRAEELRAKLKPEASSPESAAGKPDDAA